MIRIPPHILYPGIIFALLGMSFTMSTILVLTSRSGDGLQLEHNYYERSVNWDQSQEELQKSARLGWTLDITMNPTPLGHVVITDAANQPVEGLNAQITLRRPQFADDISTTPLTPVADQPGRYAFSHPPSPVGVWDLIIEGEFSEQSVRFERRHEVD